MGRVGEAAKKAVGEAWAFCREVVAGQVGQEAVKRTMERFFSTRDKVLIEILRLPEEDRKEWFVRLERARKVGREDNLINDLRQIDQADLPQTLLTMARLPDDDFEQAVEILHNAPFTQLLLWLSLKFGAAATGMKEWTRQKTAAVSSPVGRGAGATGARASEFFRGEASALSKRLRLKERTAELRAENERLREERQRRLRRRSWLARLIPPRNKAGEEANS